MADAHMKNFDIQTALRIAQLATEAASTVAMKYFRQPIKLEYKHDKSIVTVLDLGNFSRRFLRLRLPLVHITQDLSKWMGIE